MHFPRSIAALLIAAGLTALASAAEPPAQPDIDVVVGHSYIYQAPGPVARVLISDEKVAQVQLLETGQIQILGEALGTTDLWIWTRGAPTDPVRSSITVRRDLSQLQERLEGMLFDQPPVRVYPLENRVVVEGAVKDAETLKRVQQLVAVYDPQFVDHLRVEGDQQVQLNVVFAEVNRSRLREMGLEALWRDGGLIGDLDLSAAVAPASLGTDAFQITGAVVGEQSLAATLAVLEQNNLSKTLARPTLVALSGQQAEFLAGGEVPIPVAQYADRVTIDFKEYGVKVNFKPTVLADGVIDLEVYVEVSAIDPTHSVSAGGVSIPALSSRKGASHVRLEDGMTFAMAGMLDETVQATFDKIPILGDIPLVGALFRHVRHEKSEIEILIFVTPELVRPLAPGETPPVPGADVDNDPNDFRFFLLGSDHDRQPPEPVEGVGLERE